MKVFKLLLVSLLMFSLFGCSNSENKEESKVTYENAITIKLNGDSATIDGNVIEEFDYTWNVDPSVVHDEVKNAPAEYYTGEKPDTDDICYIDHELYYYPLLDESLFKLVNYDGENNDYIFATLPNLNKGKVPTDMMHSSEEASNNKVLHITKEGTYILSGNWNGQIKVDLGEDAFTDETKKVVIVLDNVDINCTVAPGIIFENIYECDNTWEEKESYPNEIDTTDAGVTVIIADGSTNNVSGYNVYRMLKTKYKDDESTDQIKTQKKMRKTDAAFYSYVSMNIESEPKNTGILNITSNFEGLDTELHLTINGGNITINSGDDGINVNEDNVSIASFFGGNITINAAQGAEGDGIDSNGYVVIDGATLNINNVKAPDNSVDSEDGVLFKSGTIYIDGEEYKTEETNLKEISSSTQGFGGGFNRGDFDPNNFNGEMPEGMTPPEGFDGQKPDDMTPPDGFNGEKPDDMPEGMEPPEGFNGEMPEGMTPPEGFNGEKPDGMPNNDTQSKKSWNT